MVLKVPFNGVLIESDTKLYPGIYIMKDQWLADVINPNSLVIEAFVSQIDLNYITIGSKGYFYASNLSVKKIPVTVTSIEVLQSRSLECRYSKEIKQNKGQESVVETPCYNASDLGGDIPSYASDQGGFVPSASVYRVVLKTDKEIDLSHVERGSVSLETPSQSYAFRAFYDIKSIFIQELGF